MLKTFTFQNFLSFKDEAAFSLESHVSDKGHEESYFETGKISLLKSAVIYGPNASGKSSFTKALIFFQNFVTIGLQMALNPFIQVIPFVLSPENEKLPSRFEIEIVKNGEVYVYGFEVTQQRILKEWLIQKPYNKILFEREGDRIDCKRSFKEANEALKSQTRSNVLFLTILASYNGQISKDIVEEIRKIHVFSTDQRTLALGYSFDRFNVYKEEILEFILEADFGIKTVNVEEKEISKEEFEGPIPPELRSAISAGRTKFTHRKISTIHRLYNSNADEVG